jgi:Fe-S-cluster containining protein
MPQTEKVPPCDSCPARCCKYFALEIDKPVEPADYDRILWYLLHDKVVVWVQDGEWFLEIRNRCLALGDDDRCTDYSARPSVCREYGMSDDADCEYDGESLEFEQYFDSAAVFRRYADEQLKKRASRLARRRELYKLRRKGS